MQSTRWSVRCSVLGVCLAHVRCMALSVGFAHVRCRSVITVVQPSPPCGFRTFASPLRSPGPVITRSPSPRPRAPTALLLLRGFLCLFWIRVCGVPRSVVLCGHVDMRMSSSPAHTRQHSLQSACAVFSHYTFAHPPERVHTVLTCEHLCLLSDRFSGPQARPCSPLAPSELGPWVISGEVRVSGLGARCGLIRSWDPHTSPGPASLRPSSFSLVGSLVGTAHLVLAPGGSPAWVSG